MLNQVMLIGTLDSDPIEVSNPYSNLTHKIFVKSGKEDDVIAIYIWRGLADAMSKYPVGTMLGIKGTLKVHEGQLIVAGEKVSFITEGK